jgi:predicted RNA binding protein YcfA (HicA-like mRNA interferase family)
LWCDNEEHNNLIKRNRIYGWKCMVTKGSHHEHKCYKHGEKGKVDIPIYRTI